MRFALLCDDPLVSPLIDALGSSIDGHQIGWAVRVNPQAEQLLFGRTGIKHVEHWEDLLTTTEIDAIIVGGSDPLIQEGAKQLATAGLPILFLPQAAHGSTLIYELSLIHDDNHVVLSPVFWHRYDAATNHLKSMLQVGKLGRIQFLQLTSLVAQPSSSTLIPQSRIDAELLHGAALLRWLTGDYNQVTALQTAASSEGALMENVVLAGRSLPEASWTINSAIDGGDWRLIIRGENGDAELLRNKSAGSYVYQFDGNRVEGEPQNTACQLIASFASLVQQQSNGDPESTQSIDDDWSELIKCFETVDAANRSIRRKRTIELHFEPMSERAIFKTQMTAIGCGLLIATFFLTLCYLGLASIVPLPSYILIGLRTLVFAPLVLFLIAQVLLPLTRPSSGDNS